MYFYHGNKHYYLTHIFLGDQTLRDILYANGLTSNYEDLCYALADQLYEEINSYFTDSVSAIEFYDNEYANYQENSSYISSILNKIQTAIYLVYAKQYNWYYPGNKGLYVSILKSLIYGSIKHFFYENRDKYLPQYDWYLINQNNKRKDIVEMLFKEFDKLANIGDSLKYYQDPDDIPLEFLIYLQEITGLTMNNYGNVFTQLQLRSLTKNLINIWREKGSTFSIELFFACMGIQCDISELWFDRRLYYNPDKFNDYTNEHDPNNFGFYLTPFKPHTVSYEFSSESIDYADYTSPRSSRMWDYIVKNSSDPDILEKLLGIEDSDEELVYTFFKSNYLLINFSYIGQNRTVSREELDTYKELTKQILPVFIRTYYGNEYTTSYGGDQYDIFKWYDPSTDKTDTGRVDIVDEDKVVRPAEIYHLFDTGLDVEPYNGLEKNAYLYDAYISVYVGSNFVSGTRMYVYDTRLSQYITVNGIENPESINELATSPTYDMIGGNLISDLFYSEYPVFYNQEHEYKWYFLKTTDTAIDPEKTYYICENDVYYRVEQPKIEKMFVKTEDSEVIQGKTYYIYENDVYSIVPNPVSSELNNYYENVYYELNQNTLLCDDGTVGTLEIITTDDISDPAKHTSSPDETPVYRKITRYYFKVNSETRYEIYPVLFVDNNNGNHSIKNEGLENQLPYTEVENPMSFDLGIYYEFVKTEDAEVDPDKTYYVYADGIYSKVLVPINSELGDYYEFVKTTDTQILLGKTYYILNYDDETFNEPYEQQINWTYDVYNGEEEKYEVLDYETFDPKYTDETQNLFESSSWKDDIKTFNNLYDGEVWSGHIKYEYSQYTNPILYIDTDIPDTIPLNEHPITITLI